MRRPQGKTDASRPAQRTHVREQAAQQAKRSNAAKRDASCPCAPVSVGAGRAAVLALFAFRASGHQDQRVGSENLFFLTK